MSEIYAIEGNVVDRISSKNGKGWCEDVSPTLNTQDRHAVVYTIDALTSNSMKSSNPHSGIHETQVAKCLDTRCLDPSCNQGGHMVVIALEGNGARPSHMGNGYSEGDTMYTLNTIEQHSVCYAVENHPNDSRVTIDPDGIVQTLSSRMGTGGNNTPFVLIAFDAYQHHNWRQAETIGPLTTNCSTTVRGDTPIVLIKEKT